MGKGKRNRANRSHIDVLKKREELAKKIEKLNKKMGIKWHETLRIKIWTYLYRLKVQHISRVVYDTYLTHEKKWFRKIVYSLYAEGKLFKDFGDFHNTMSTKCAINDNEWVKYIDYDGNIVRSEFYEL
jgi:hypothetical protein